MSPRPTHTAAPPAADRSEVREAPPARARSGRRPKTLRLDELKPRVAHAHREGRDAAGLSQRDLAEIADLKRSLVAAHELGTEREAPTVLHVLDYARLEITRPLALALVRLLEVELGRESVPLPAVREQSSCARLHGLTCELTDVLRVVSESETDGGLSVGELRERLRESRQAVDALLELIAHDERELARQEGRP